MGVAAGTRLTLITLQQLVHKPTPPGGARGNVQHHHSTREGTGGPVGSSGT